VTTRTPWWRRLLRWWSPPAATAPRPSEPLPAAPAARVPSSGPEAWLADLIAAAAEGHRREEVGADLFWTHVRTLHADGHALLAIQWLDKFVAAPGTPPECVDTLRTQLCEWLIDRGTSGRAVPHLEALTDRPAHALRAHYLLGEHYRHVGDEARALRHYEAVLAIDVDYPNVRARAARIRAARGGDTRPVSGTTLRGADAFPGTTGARYQLTRELGRGATGVVYLARDTQLEREVAVKLLHPHVAAARGADACARFFEEARLAASLRHPNIVAVLDIDERARRMVMELAAGGTLRDVLRDRGPRTLRRALERHAQILSALAAAHRRGIVHRDLKPGNLMFRRDPDAPGSEIILGDFGVAHLPNPEHTEQRPASAVGTLAYMAPEQRSGAATARSDVYAAAVVLYEMLVGRTPWTRDVLLAGTRSEDDFTLPAALVATWPASMRDRIARHLAWLGAPTAHARPDSDAALADARRLRDLAIAG